MQEIKKIITFFKQLNSNPFANEWCLWCFLCAVSIKWWIFCELTFLSFIFVLLSQLNNPCYFGSVSVETETQSYANVFFCHDMMSLVAFAISKDAIFWIVWMFYLFDFTQTAWDLYYLWYVCMAVMYRTEMSLFTLVRLPVNGNAISITFFGRR